ncbi:polyphosphate:AMP phosphotransferase [Teredinibacter haidensis]|uniref:polyphosphate:AMP phosphotransferase n=1 Tax=Teredinibacter haidensis TaxID=2731755 RepID=UPI000948FB2D|nr:polyphosphate:AMP phosphotransferase [Teredinibacter haidensis]
MTELSQPAPVISKEDYKERVRLLRAELLQLQHRIRERDKPVIIVIAGDDRSGRHETINALSKWMDPRFLSVNAYGPTQYDEDIRPFFWRFWRDLPGAGEVAVYLRDWTSTSIVQYLNGEISEKKLRKRETYIQNFEKKHTDDGALMIKCWLHITEPVLRKRVAEIRDTPYFDVKDELALKNYPEAMEAIQKTLDATSTPTNHWYVIDGSDAQLRNLEVGEIIKRKLQNWLDQTEQKAAEPDVQNGYRGERVVIDVPPEPEDARPDRGESKVKLKKLQTKLRKLMFEIRKHEIPVVMAFEGWDAAGKGGAIRRLVSSLDAGFYRIKPIAKPTEDEYAHNYMWRFWRDIPRNGQMTIYDRSWYGRVLVERVEGFAKDNEWQRAYKEINDFEEQLTIHNTIVLKFWINISKEEQLSRFEDREQTDYKKFKITEEDYRNRERWDDYVVAVEDMIERTSTEHAPWSVISTDFKDKARLEVLGIVVNAFKKKLKQLEKTTKSDGLSNSTE